MAAAPLMGTPQKTSKNNHQSSYFFALVILSSLFFVWGFITNLNDTLIPHLKNAFSLNYFEALLIQFCFFGAYFVMSLPAGALVKRIGYKWGLVVGLIVAAVGCLLFIPAAMSKLYPLFLGALFILASGITVLQVAANPYVTILGKPETASFRLTLTQALNSLGGTLAPWAGSLLILSTAAYSVTDLSAAEQAAMRLQEADAVKFPYLLLAIALGLLAAIFAALKLPDMREEEEQQALDHEQGGSAWKYRHLVLGAVGLFAYVGAEVTIGSTMINFLELPNIGGFTATDAAKYVSYYWGGALIGRFIGSAVMYYISASKVLAFNAVVNVALLAIAVSTSGSTAMWSIIAIGLFNSIMFPTIFSLALTGLGHHTSQGSGILCQAIVGGAIVPVITGKLADAFGLHAALALPIICYVYIAWYGLQGYKPKH
ncbi:major facilitator transporter [Shewanella mangrovi]|uniref:Major facilitator transporter n=1 Tax=Shewanella mangrovi TaxID=1515746 RepID=A0A094JL33_9GAMM|nr:sugar MFS transporter [Shewanella mangrovi]KFZ38769.1 major facilitator transporter [Shewanella mangrovi]